MIKKVINLISDKIGEIFSIIILIAIIISSFSLSASSSLQESAVMDELAHIPAGYSYINNFDYRLNPEHPPLIKALSALPLKLMGLNFPIDEIFWTDYINGQWDMGNNFLYKANQDRADSIIFTSRIFPLLIFLLLVFFVYWWSRKLMGNWWALIPAFFTALSPNFLAHSHYVTTDVGAAFGFFVGLYFFVRYLSDSSKKNLIWAGVFFGIAQLTKFSVILLIPIFIILVICWWWFKTKDKGLSILSSQSFLILWKYIKGLISIFAIGFVLVWIVYFIFTLNYPIEKQTADTKFILGSFAGGSDQMWSKCNLSNLSIRCLADIDIWMSSVPVLRGFGEYLLGLLMVMQRSSGGNTAYFLGNVSGGGWWYYFPVIYLLKESLAALLLVIGGFFLFLTRFVKNKFKTSFSNLFSFSFPEFAMILFVVFYWVYSIKSPLNIGFRHIIPTLPFIYILATGSLKKWIQTTELETKKVAKVFLIIILMGWLIIESLIAYPHFISYFNQFGGGTFGGYKYVTDSNYDWGQDMLKLKSWVNENKVDKIAIDYFGGGDIKYYFGDKGETWNSSKGNPVEQGIDWLAISVNSLQSAKANPINFERKPEDSYQWLSNYKEPYARAGTSIFIYRLR
ncbi:MAG: glycosyltransferase family 39 protein [Candidatus Paceibacterota bacterium]|jgi:4-amino-4-deoxy-L-arabinose transferase-like glycosyltransferase